MQKSKAPDRLDSRMTLAEFDHGYWYAVELKRFAKSLGIAQSGILRKDQLEDAIRSRLRGGAIATPRRQVRRASFTEPRDVDRGLHPRQRVIRYTNDPETKAFLEREAVKLDASYRRRSGARYRLNRWREEQIARGVKLTYGQLVAAYVRLSRPSERYERIGSTRYINFLAEYLSHETGASRASAIAAWHAVKRMDCPNTYQAWRKARRGQRGER